MTISATRIGDGPIIHQGMCESLGDNINGPSLVERPSWLPGPGRFLLYFSHHKGQHIRLAFADRLEGPWQVHAPGVLPLGVTPLEAARHALHRQDVGAGFRHAAHGLFQIHTRAVKGHC